MWQVRLWDSVTGCVRSEVHDPQREWRLDGWTKPLAITCNLQIAAATWWIRTRSDSTLCQITLVPVELCLKVFCCCFCYVNVVGCCQMVYLHLLSLSLWGYRSWSGCMVSDFVLTRSQKWRWLVQVQQFFWCFLSFIVSFVVELF